MNFYSKKSIFRQCFYEFFGTGLMIFFGTSCLAASKLTYINYSLFETSLIWGFGVSVSIYFSYSISGAHLNPAITIFFWLSSKFNKKKVLPYILSQISGAFFFTIITYYLYSDALITFEKTHHIIRGTKDSIDIAAIFCIYPNKNNGFIYNFMVEMLVTAFFMFILLQFNNKKNYLLYYSSIKPILIGLVVSIINMSVCPENNISLNPARDLGPKIFLSITGWGVLSFTGGNNFLYFLIPVIGPIMGASLGGWVYHLLNKKINKKYNL